MSSTLLACCCGSTPPPGGTCLCAHTIAVTISGLVKHPDVINCCGTPPVGGACPGCASCNTIIRPPAPNGTYLLTSCALPANGCAFMVDLNQPYSPPGAVPCPCNAPWSALGTVFNNCTVVPPANIRSWIALTLGTFGVGSSMGIQSVGAMTVGSHTCTYCCGVPGSCVTTSGDYQGVWQIPSGNSNPAVSLAAFCAGTPFTLSGVASGSAYSPCGFNGAGTHTTGHQGAGPMSMTVQLVN